MNYKNEEFDFDLSKKITNQKILDIVSLLQNIFLILPF